MDWMLKHGALDEARFLAGSWFGRLVATIAIAQAQVWAAEHSAAAQFRKEVQPILKEYCYDCHADGMRKGGVAFDSLADRINAQGIERHGDFTGCFKAIA